MHEAVLALWARDITLLRSRKSFFSGKNKLDSLLERYTAMPMEPAAIAMLGEDRPYILPDLWLTADEKTECFDKGQALLDAWVASCGEKSIQSRMRVEFIHPFTSLFIASALLKSWREKGLRKLACVERSPLSAAGYWYASDIPLAVWKESAPDIYLAIAALPRFKRVADTLKRRTLNAIQRMRRIAGRVKRRLIRVREKPLPPLPNVSGAIVFFIAPWELDRHAHLIRKSSETGREVVLFLIDGACDAVEAAQKSYGIRVYGLPCHVAAGGVEQRDWVQDLPLLLKEYPLAAELFAKYLQTICPVYHNFYKRLSDILKKGKAELALTPHSQDTFTCLCERACLDTDVPVVTIPHAAVESVQFTPMNEEDAHLLVFTSPLVQEAYTENAVAVRSLAVNDIFMSSEYPVSKLSADASARECVLFIFAVSQVAPSLWYHDGPAARIGLLRGLEEFCPKLEESYDCLFKLHPTWPERELFTVAGVKPERILPLDSDLQALLRKTALLVSVNYSASPVVQAIERDVPVLHINTMSGTRKRFMTNFEKKLFETGLPFAWSIEDARLWSEKLLFDASARERVIEAQRSAVLSKLVGHPLSWSQCLKDILHDRESIRKLPFVYNKQRVV